jgi:hypothetical protein
MKYVRRVRKKLKWRRDTTVVGVAVSQIGNILIQCYAIYVMLLHYQKLIERISNYLKSRRGWINGSERHPAEHPQDRLRSVCECPVVVFDTRITLFCYCGDPVFLFYCSIYDHRQGAEQVDVDTDTTHILVMRDEKLKDRALVTAKALYVMTTNGSPDWLPKSIIHSEFNPYDYELWQEVEVEMWWLRRNNLITY